MVIGARRGLSWVEGLEEFQPVTDRIAAVEASVPREVLVEGDLVSMPGEAGSEGLDVGDSQAGVCLAGRLEVLFDSEVKHGGSGGEPAASSGGQRRGFGQFGHAEEVAVEGA